MKKLIMIAGVLSGVLMAGCSSNFEDKLDDLKDEAKVYSQSREVYCGGEGVKTYYEAEGIVSISCMDGSNKTQIITLA